MNLRVSAAVLLGRLARRGARLIHRGGTDFPGRVALRVCPELLEILSDHVAVVAVTGTNGKTTTSRMIEQTFLDSGISCFANRSGANLHSGITAEFLAHATLSGKSKCSRAVIECDEAAARTVFPRLRPDVVLVTNLFRDQLDRYGEVTHTLENIRYALSSTPETTLCLNADCSLTASLAEDLPNSVIWYGMEQGARPSHPRPELSDALYCIRCKTEYDYDYITYGHLGGFRCPKCGYRRHDTDVSVTRVFAENYDGSQVEINVDDTKKTVLVNLPALYNVYNAVGAVCAACAMGIDRSTAVEAMSHFQRGCGRMEEFSLGEKGATMMLVKNPAGCDQVIDFLSRIREPFGLVVCLNDRAADGRDISWIWDVDFERLFEMTGQLRQLFVSGERAFEMKMRLKYAGIPEEQIYVERDYSALVESLSHQQVPVFMLPNYTAMLELRHAVIGKVGGTEFWE